MLIVQKFGGSSVADTERIFNVAKIITDTYKNGNKVLVVLSAQGDTTDDLIQKAAEITGEPSKREMDMLLSTGEQQSIALMVMAIHKLGLPAISLTGSQVGIFTSTNHTNARIKKIASDRLRTELEKNNIVVVAGFQGFNRYEDITTLGRGGSDTTAVAIAAALDADLCEIYTDVDGVYTADPRVVKNARKLENISYDEMLELASLGAKVLHSRSVELAKKYKVNLVVRSSMSGAEGTLIKEDVKVENIYVSGLAIDKDTARITVIGIKDELGMAFRLFSLLSKKKISVDVIVQSIGKNRAKDITFTVGVSSLTETLSILEANKDLLCYDHISFDDKIAKLSIVGAGMATDSGVATLMFEALYDCGVNIDTISTSEIKISVLIDEKDVDKAANYVHDAFLDQNINLSM